MILKFVVGTALLLSAVPISPIHGEWTLQLKLETYVNMHHAYYNSIQSNYVCCDCPLSSGMACFASSLSSLGDRCVDRDCYNRFVVCVRDGTGNTAERCVYSRTISDEINNDDITFDSNGPTLGGITNPLKFTGSSEGPLRVSITIFDDPGANDNSRYDQKLIDEVIVESIGVNPDPGSFTMMSDVSSENGVVTMDLSYKVQCAEGYSGDTCNIAPVQPTENTGSMMASSSSVSPSSPSVIGSNTVSGSSSRPISPTTTPTGNTAVCYDSRLNASEIALSVYDSLSQLMDCGRQGEQRAGSTAEPESGDTDIVSVVFLILILIISAVTAIGTMAVLICLIKFKQSKITNPNNYELK